jgi:hypothetical protein
MQDRKLVVKKVVLKGKMAEAPTEQDRHLAVRSGATAAYSIWESSLSLQNVLNVGDAWRAWFF